MTRAVAGTIQPVPRRITECRRRLVSRCLGFGWDVGRRHNTLALKMYAEPLDVELRRWVLGSAESHDAFTAKRREATGKVSGRPVPQRQLEIGHRCVEPGALGAV